jgi:DNA primase large subunit
MDRLHARYPFLDAAREAVDAADVDLGGLVRRGGAPVERGVERVETAVATGGVGEMARVRTELLSYPVARVVVSLVGDDRLTAAYARAEAHTAHERFVADIEEPAPASLSAGIDRDRLLAEFDLDDAVRPVERGEGDHAVDVGPYLRLASELSGERWRLVARDLRDGRVPVTDEELYALLREAVRERVLDGLPLSVPEAVADALDAEVARVSRALSDYELPRGVGDEVTPAAFPPCVRQLVERTQAGERLPDHAEFALVAFLAGVGADLETAAAVAGVDPEAIEYRHERLAGRDGADYPSPSCTVMQAYGDCVPETERDDLCAAVDHPLNYYATAVERGDPEAGE